MGCGVGGSRSRRTLPLEGKLVAAEDPGDLGHKGGVSVGAGGRRDEAPDVLAEDDLESAIAGGGSHGRVGVGVWVCGGVEVVEVRCGRGWLTGLGREGDSGVVPTGERENELQWRPFPRSRYQRDPKDSSWY